MNVDYERQFQKCLDRSEESRLKKLMRSPIQTLRARTMQTIAERFRVVMPTTAVTFWGRSMNVVLPELISVSLFRYGYYEESLTRMLLQHLSPGMVFVDIGAHFGYYSLLASALVGDGGSVHAFEPTPRTFKILQSNLEGLKNVCTERLAVFSREDTLQFNDFGVTLSALNSLFGMRVDSFLQDKLPEKPQGQQFDVSTTTLDAYLERKHVVPNFVKIDAESSEFEILRGMARTLTEAKPVISIEVGDMGVAGLPPSRDLLRYVMDYGYRPLEYKAGAFVEHRLKDTYKYDNIFLLPDP